MVAAYEEKQQELRTLKKGKTKSNKGSKKRRRKGKEDQASDDEVCAMAICQPLSSYTYLSSDSECSPPATMLHPNPLIGCYAGRMAMQCLSVLPPKK